MIVAEIKGNVWATCKNKGLDGLKLMVVQRVNTINMSNTNQETFVAVDCVGAGIGERVLVTLGSSARFALNSSTIDIPVDAAIVAILDESNKS